MEVQVGDQALGRFRAGLIEFVRAMCGFAEKDNTRPAAAIDLPVEVAESPLEGVRCVEDDLGCFVHRIASTGFSFAPMRRIS